MATTNEIMLMRLLHERDKLWKARAETAAEISKLEAEIKMEQVHVRRLQDEIEERVKRQTALRFDLRAYEKAFNDEAKSFADSLRDNECGGDIKLAGS